MPSPEHTTAPRADDAVRAVIAAEESLLTPRVRGDRAALEALLSEDFHEFGISGHAWEREEIIEALVVDHDLLDITMSDVAGTMLAPDLVLLTYVTADQGVPRARRSSLWRLEQGRWRLVHHQGSPYS